MSSRSTALVFFLSVFFSVGIGLNNPFSQSPAGQEQFLPGVMGAPLVLAQGLPTSLTKVDHSRPLSRIGVLTNTQSHAAVIDGNIYPLAIEIVIEDRKGTPITVKELQGFRWDAAIDMDVRYWLASNEIVQMIVSLPE